MAWPAFIDDPGIEKAGTLYVSRGRIPQYFERHAYSGQAWRVGNEYTTYCPNRARSYKSTARLRFRSMDDFNDLMERCQVLGLRPPISYADLFFQQQRLPCLPRYSWSSPFRRFTFGGWEKALYTGEYRGPVYQYDLNSAYRWAGQIGLPDIRKLERSYRFNDPLGIYLVVLKENSLPYAPGAGLHCITSEERDVFDVRPEKFILGIRANGETQCIAEAFAALEKTWPERYLKPMARAYWGKFNTRLGPKQISWKRGQSEHQQSNFFFNPIWSAFITSRVKMRLCLYRSIALHVYVDSILTTRPIPQGDDVGSFRLLDSDTDGCYIKGNTQWKFGPNPPARWSKNTTLGDRDGNLEGKT